MYRYMDCKLLWFGLIRCIRLWKVSASERLSQSSLCWAVSTACCILRGAAVEMTSCLMVALIKLFRITHAIIPLLEMTTKAVSMLKWALSLFSDSQTQVSLPSEWGVDGTSESFAQFCLSAQSCKYDACLEDKGGCKISLLGVDSYDTVVFLCRRFDQMEA